MFSQKQAKELEMQSFPMKSYGRSVFQIDMYYMELSSVQAQIELKK